MSDRVLLSCLYPDTPVHIWTLRSETLHLKQMWQMQILTQEIVKLIFSSLIPWSINSIVKEKNKVINDFQEMYNNKIPVKPISINSKTLLVSPKNRRDEVKRLKDNFAKYVELKQTSMFLNKRNRQLKLGYRDKIRDVIIRPKTSASDFFTSTTQNPRRKTAKRNSSTSILFHPQM